jgi:hypothetical protein
MLLNRHNEHQRPQQHACRKIEREVVVTQQPKIGRLPPERFLKRKNLNTDALCDQRVGYEKAAENQKESRAFVLKRGMHQLSPAR